MTGMLPQNRGLTRYDSLLLSPPPTVLLQIALAAMLLVLAAPLQLQAISKRTKAAERVDEARMVLDDSLAGPDRRIPQDLLDRADCVGIFPSVLKGAFLVGGRYGKGVVTCRTPDSRWSGPVTFRIEGGNIGFQIGGNTTDLVLLFLGPKSINRLMRTNFTLGIDGTAAAGPVGRSAMGQTDALFGAEVISYSRSRGLFAGVALDGATLRPDHKANRTLYGFNPATRDVFRGEVPPPEGAGGLLELLSRQSPQKRVPDREADEVIAEGFGTLQQRAEPE